MKRPNLCFSTLIKVDCSFVSKICKQALFIQTASRDLCMSAVVATTIVLKLKQDGGDDEKKFNELLGHSSLCMVMMRQC